MDYQKQKETTKYEVPNNPLWNYLVKRFLNDNPNHSKNGIMKNEKSKK